jgi:hypothetical protein
MAVSNPTVSGVWPANGDTSIVLKPIVQVIFKSPDLIDPLTWNSGTFALYGPGDVIYETGPGTLLNSGIILDPYVLIDGAVIRERIEGTYRLYTSGLPPSSGLVVSGYLAASGSVVIAEFIPNVPLNAYTTYSCILAGEDASSWLSNTAKIFPGVTSYTSAAQFAPSGAASGIVDVITSYTRTLPTILWDSTTGYNDTYSLFITSGSTRGSPKFLWEQISDGTLYPSEGQGPHNLDEGLTFLFSGTFVSGEQYNLDVYIPQPLARSYAWSFSTSEISGSVPPSFPVEPSLIIDLTHDGGTYPVTDTDIPLAILRTWPEDLDYGVRNDLPMIMIEFNKVLLSGSLDISKFHIQCTSILGMPNYSGTGSITPAIVEYSGVFLKLWL